MKIAIALCTLIVLSGCTATKQEGPTAIGGKGNPNGDSPIVVSDGAHLRHKAAAGDFQLFWDGTNPDVNIVSDTGAAPLTIRCKQMTLVSGPSDCTTTNGIPLDPSSWMLQLFDGASGSGSKIMTLKFNVAATSPQIVNALFHNNFLDPEHNTDTLDTDLKDGTDISEYDSDGNPLEFQSAKFVNGAAKATIITCTTPVSPSNPCKIKFTYPLPAK